MKKTLCALAAGLVAGVLATVPTTTAEARGSMNIRAASFNVLSVSLDGTSGNKRPWRERRSTVIRQILSEDLDVLGAQELNHSKHFAPRLVDGITQMTDLRNGLNKAGGNWQLTNSYSFNCVNASTQHKCAYKYRAASGDNRILFNKDTLMKVRQGTYKFKAQGTTFVSYMPWAVLQTKATGDKFIFATTHLTTAKDGTRRKQWNELIAKVKQLRSTYGHPVIVTGDFNEQKFSPLAADMLPKMKSSGFGDVVGQEAYESRVDNPRAERRINGFINSLNRLDRNVRNYSYHQDRSRMGNTIDYVFATNSLDVPEYKLVLDYGDDLQVDGTFASDHSMIRSTITLP